MQYQGYTHNSVALDFDSFVFEAGYLDDEEDISGEATASNTMMHYDRELWKLIIVDLFAHFR
jgi:hypothetical protein